MQMSSNTFSKYFYPHCKRGNDLTELTKCTAGSEQEKKARLTCSFIKEDKTFLDCRKIFDITSFYDVSLFKANYIPNKQSMT